MTTPVTLTLGRTRRTRGIYHFAGEGLASLVDKWVLIHVGFAMAIIDEKEAEKTMQTLHALGEAQQEFEAMFESDRSLEARHEIRR